ncbi:hypothetical protein ACFOFO_00835 [Undibacterium arcticum]|uniref:Uncharacterized protein n=1 Tax=Undibacterium arcticum TaxID=1762892 RepID=A0ABV7EYI4_9BURK
MELLQVIIEKILLTHCFTGSAFRGDKQGRFSGYEVRHIASNIGLCTQTSGGKY